MKLAFYKGRGRRVFDRLICWWTRGEFSHCELCFDDEPESMCLSSSIMDGGVRAKRIRLDPERWVFVEVQGDRTAAVNWFADRIGKKYDWLGILGFIWRAGRDSPNRYFCSEACAAALGFPEPWRFDPNTLYAAMNRSPSCLNG